MFPCEKVFGYTTEWPPGGNVKPAGAAASEHARSAVHGFCYNKRCVLSRQTRVCRNISFVAIKMILVAAPANNTDMHMTRL